VCEIAALFVRGAHSLLAMTVSEVERIQPQQLNLDWAASGGKMNRQEAGGKGSRPRSGGARLLYGSESAPLLRTTTYMGV